MHWLNISSPFLSRGFVQGTHETMTDGTRLYSALSNGVTAGLLFLRAAGVWSARGMAAALHVV